MKYDAFISYRHAPLDMEIAKKVHSGLENYHVPAATQKKIGKKKINRVFRDQEELPIGSDLDDNISGALAESEYLIVICSPRTPGSYWVCKEIDTFIYLHDRDHVLAVLIEGEPNESFPHQLLVDEKGKAVEPLAADVRGLTAKERNNKFKTEILRLAAPVLGCNYDDLKQRHRERIIRRNITIAASIAGVTAIAGAAFGVYNAGVARKMSKLANEKAQLADEKTILADEKTQLAEEKTRLAEEILEEYNDKQANQSRYLAAESLSLYSEGNVKDAVLVAQAALPSDDDDRPYVPAAEYALGNALHAYSTGNGAEFSGLLEHNSHVDGMTADPETARLVSYDRSEAVYVWYPKEGEELTYIAPKNTAYGQVDEIVQVGINGDTILVARQNGITEYDLDGNVLCELQSDNYIIGCEFYPDSNLAIAVANEEIMLVDLTDCTVSGRIENTYELSYAGKMVYCENKGIAAVAHYNPDNSGNYVEIIDTVSLESRIVDVSDQYITDLSIDENGNIAVASYDTMDAFAFESSLDISLDYIDGENARLLWSKNESPVISHTSTYDIFVRAHSYGEGEDRKSEIVLAVDNNIYSYDTEGNLISYFGVSESIEAIIFSETYDTGMVAEYDGNIDYVNFDVGSTTVPGYINAGRTITDMAVENGYLMMISMADSNIALMSYEKAYDLTEIADNDYSIRKIDVSPDGKYVIPVGYDEHYAVYDGDGNFIEYYDADYSGSANYTGFTENDNYVSISGSVMYVYDAKSGDNHSYTLTPQDYSWETFREAGMCNDGRNILAFGSTAWSIADTENGELKGFGTTESTITGIAVSDDLSAVYICTGDGQFYIYDIATGEKSILSDEYRSPMGMLNNAYCLTVSPDGRFAALLCSDGNIRLFDTDDRSVITTVSVNAQSYFYAEFTYDSSSYIYQADDQELHFINISDASSVAAVEVGASICGLNFDAEKGIIAIKTNGGLILIDDSSYTKLAEVDGGEGYVSGSGRIYAFVSRQIVSFYYKDYRELLSYASEKYGDSSLTDEEKIKYFLD